MKFSFIFLIPVIFLLMFAPLVSHGKTVSIFEGINIWQGATCGGNVIGEHEGPSGPCGFCDAIIVASNIMKYMFDAVFFVLFPLFFAWGAIQLMISAGNSTKVKQAKQILVSTVVGFVIALASWFIVGLLFYLLSYLSNNSTNNPNVTQTIINPWNKIECGNK